MSGDLRKKPILITGLHRSGSTWVGKMLSHEPSLAYIHEPFSIFQRPGICRAAFDSWFPYICEKNGSQFYDAIKDCLQFRYQWAEEVSRLSTIKDLVRMARDGCRFAFQRSLMKRPLIKDPIALFSAEWLARSFNMDVLLIVRHPAAFAGSLKKANWHHPFDHFLRQPMLMEDLLSGYKSEIETYSRDKKDIIDQAILLWNIANSVIKKYMDHHTEWCFIKHETLSNAPLEGFQEIYERFGLDYSSGIRKKILRFSNVKKRGNYSEHELMRNSRSNILSWKKRLTFDEIVRIREGTHGLWRNFYSDDDWV